MTPTHYEVPTSLVGALSLAVVVLAGVVGLLFKLYVARNQRAEDGTAAKDALMAVERTSFLEREHAWETEREQIRADAERRVREATETYATELAEMRDQYLGREDGLRKDFGDRIERIAAEASKSALAQAEVLNKLYERFVGPRRPRTNG